MNAPPLSLMPANATKELKARLYLPRDYGKSEQDLKVLKLCSDLEMDLIRFINFNQPLEEFKSIFLTRAHSQDDALKQTKAWVLIANIAIACLFLAIPHLIKFLHSQYTTGKGSFLFFEQAGVQGKISQVDEALSPRLRLIVFNILHKPRKGQLYRCWGSTNGTASRKFHPPTYRGMSAVSIST